MRAKTIEYKHIMDDNAGVYYDQHVYITHRIANMVVRDVFIKEYLIIFVDFHKNSTIFSKFCLITQKWALRNIFFYADW